MLSELPIVQAPMGGGPSTPELAAAVGEAGGLGFLAAGYRSVAAVRADIAALRGLSRRPFGINLFAPPAEPGEPAEIATYAEELRGDAERRGVELGEPRHDDDGWEEKLALCADEEGTRHTVEIALVPPVAVGDQLLVHAGTAIAGAAA